MLQSVAGWVASSEGSTGLEVLDGSVTWLAADAGYWLGAQWGLLTPTCGLLRKVVSGLSEFSNGTWFSPEQVETEWSFLIQPWKPHSATSILLCWLKQEQAHPYLRRRDIESTSHWKEWKNIWDHFLNCHTCWHMFSVSCFFFTHGSCFMASYLCDSTVLCFTAET